MKKNIHVLGAVFGTLCAVTFAAMPFLASAEAGPSKPAVRASTSKPTAEVAGKRHMRRGGEATKDDGCGE